MNTKREICLILLVLLFFTVHIHAQANLDTTSPSITAANLDHLTELAAFTPNRGIARHGIRFIDDQTILFVSNEGLLRSWKISDFPDRVLMNIGFMSGVALDAGGRIAICQCSDDSPNQDAKLVDLASGQRSMLASKFGPMTDLALDSQGAQLAIVGGWTRDDNRVEVWDLRASSKILTIPNFYWQWSAEFNPKDDHILAVGSENSIELWNIATQEKLFTLEQVLPMTQEYSYVMPAGDLAFNTDGTILASMSPEGFIWLWDVKTGENLKLLRDTTIHVDMCDCYSSYQTRIAFSPDETLLATADGTELRFWDVAAGRLLRKVDQSTVDLAFNPSGTLLSTVDENGSLKIWSVN